MTRTTRATQVVALLLVALTMGLEFAHTLELGPKLNYPPELYLRLNTSLYAWFGPPLGAAINTGAIVATGALVWLMRRQRPALLFIGTAFVLQVAQLANYFARVEPVNVRFRALPLGQVPSDFSALRAQWEYGHAVGFALFTVAFLLLIAHPSATVVNSTAPTFSRGRMSVRSSSRRRPPDDMRHAGVGGAGGAAGFLRHDSAAGATRRDCNRLGCTYRYPCGAPPPDLRRAAALGSIAGTAGPRAAPADSRHHRIDRMCCGGDGIRVRAMGRPRSGDTVARRHLDAADRAGRGARGQPVMANAPLPTGRLTQCSCRASQTCHTHYAIASSSPSAWIVAGWRCSSTTTER